MPQNPLEKAIVSTFCYADIFDYPLTIEEIKRRLIKFKIQNSDFKKTLQNLKIIKKRKQFYYLEGKKQIVGIRRKRKKYSIEKIKIAKKTARLISIIPSVKLVGITGAVAVENADSDDDIDLLIVTSRKLLWTTRFFVTLLVELTGNRRHPKEKKVKDKICLNMFVDEDHLLVSKKERDLFSAYEVVQIRKIWDRDDTYMKFIRENMWVKEYLPNSLKIKNQKSKIKNTNQRQKIFSFILSVIRNFVYCFWAFSLESSLKYFQLWYMNKNRTAEVITDGVIRFHPKDARRWILSEYKKRIKRIKIPS